MTEDCNFQNDTSTKINETATRLSTLEKEKKMFNYV